MTEKHKIRKFLNDNDNIDDDDHKLLRDAIIEDDMKMIKLLLAEDEIYPKGKSDIFTQNELLNDTLEFFASEEITNFLKEHFGLE